MFSWSSVITKLDGETIFGLKSIAYSDKVERAYGYGQGRHHGPRGQSAGKYTPGPVTISFEKQTADLVRKKIASKSVSGTSLATVKFQLTIQYAEPGADPITDELIDCRWAGIDSKGEEGPDPLYEDAEFTCMRVLWNGIALFDDSEGQV
jgi:hypothetical protein